VSSASSADKDVAQARAAYDAWWPKARRNEIDSVAIAVSLVTGVDLIDVVGFVKLAPYVAARNLWWACLRHYCGMSYPEIGRFVDRHHSTVMFAVKRVPTDLVLSMSPLLPTWGELA
jgi:chromosomal replication initiation ATPase DnaA